MFLAWSKEPLRPLVLRHVSVYAVNILEAIAFHFGNNAIRSRADLMGIAGRNSNWLFAGNGSAHEANAMLAPAGIGC
jgi:hypothetical protein